MTTEIVSSRTPGLFRDVALARLGLRLPFVPPEAAFRAAAERQPERQKARQDGQSPEHLMLSLRLMLPMPSY
jgi:hypothetical protein